MHAVPYARERLLPSLVLTAFPGEEAPAHAPVMKGLCSPLAVYKLQVLILNRFCAWKPSFPSTIAKTAFLFSAVLIVLPRNWKAVTTGLFLGLIFSLVHRGSVVFTVVV